MGRKFHELLISPTAFLSVNVEEKQNGKVVRELFVAAKVNKLLHVLHLKRKLQMSNKIIEKTKEIKSLPLKIKIKK